MKAAGRRSAADIAAARLLAVGIEPTRELTKPEQKTWLRVLSSWPPDHFIPSDAELLTQYVAIVAAFDAARIAGDSKAMAAMGRLALSYTTKLRCTPQSRYDERTAGRTAIRGPGADPKKMRLIGGDCQ
jgi:hypothetical protein